MFDTILFDLDGTLTDPGEGITNSVAYALEKYDIKVEDKKELYKFIGPPLKDSFMKYYGFSEEEAIKAIEETAKEYLPQGYTFEYSGMTREEQSQSGGLGMILAICIIFVYLLLVKGETVWLWTAISCKAQSVCTLSGSAAAA